MSCLDAPRGSRRIRSLCSRFLRGPRLAGFTGSRATNVCNYPPIPTLSAFRLTKRFQAFAASCSSHAARCGSQLRLLAGCDWGVCRLKPWRPLSSGLGPRAGLPGSAVRHFAPGAPPPVFWVWGKGLTLQAAQLRGRSLSPPPEARAFL